MRYSILRWAHDDVHHGQNKMLERLSDRYWWPMMRNDIAKMVQTCHACQCVKGGGAASFKSGSIKTFSAANPFDLISIDICGPLPQTEKNNRYIVSIIDKFSRFCLLIPVADIRFLTVIKAYERWLSLFGPPKAVLSDNGPQFATELYKIYNQTLDIKTKYATPYYPETNGQVERLHRWIKERLTLISIDLGLNFVDGIDDWDDYIYLIQHSYNSTPNSMTKYSPNKIIFGKDLKLNIDRLNDDDITAKTPDEYIRMMENNRAVIQKKAVQHQSRYDIIRSKTYNKNRPELIKYSIGDKVLMNVKRRYVGNRRKFTATWIGPFEIIGIADRMITIREIDNDKNVQQINIKFIKPYKQSPYIAIMNTSMQMILDDDTNREYRRIYRYVKDKLSDCHI